MKSAVCEMLGIEFPLLAFSHCRDVVAAVSRAGGMGVFGAVRYSPEQLREELTWIDAHCGGKPYGVDLIVPNQFEGKGEERDTVDLVKTLPRSHREFISGVLRAHDIDSGALDEAENGRLNFARNLEDAKTVMGWNPPGVSVIDVREAAAWMALTRSLLNLDEFITRE